MRARIVCGRAGAPVALGADGRTDRRSMSGRWAYANAARRMRPIPLCGDLGPPTGSRKYTTAVRMSADSHFCTALIKKYFQRDSLRQVLHYDTMRRGARRIGPRRSRRAGSARNRIVERNTKEFQKFLMSRLCLERQWALLGFLATDAVLILVPYVAVFCDTGLALRFKSNHFYSPPRSALTFGPDLVQHFDCHRNYDSDTGLTSVSNPGFRYLFDNLAV
ncbi:hypothetical protein EVAR_59801_1 [Eumeta japonica]|uniref:Uncharacterized protein n=1 Tax=Eumeta variegata TaxID=151549 RepID=A0A4C1YGM1_EUMVA|nr:hypothetical protein EVAR_59801_1 [Eumeta japonica]